MSEQTYMVIRVGEGYPSVGFYSKVELETLLDVGAITEPRSERPTSHDFNSWPEGTYIFQVEGPVQPVPVITRYKLP